MKIFSKHTLTGIIVVGIITITSETLMIVVYASLMCTAGISLVLWIPVCYGIGYLINSIIYAIMGKSMDVKTESDQKKPNNEQKWSFISSPDNPTLKVVRKYILDAKAMNMSNEDIKDKLLTNGWDEDAIDSALNSLRESSN